MRTLSVHNFQGESNWSQDLKGIDQLQSIVLLVIRESSTVTIVTVFLAASRLM